MLKLSLAAVDRGEARVREQVPPEHPMFEGMRVELGAPLEVDLAATSVGEGVFVRGTLRTTVRLACRRCLSPVEQPVDASVDFLFVERTREDEAEQDEEVYYLPERGDELDLTQAVREQLLLDVPGFALCGEECRGLCPQCGANLNEDPAHAHEREPDARWAKLSEIKFE